MTRISCTRSHCVPLAATCSLAVGRLQDAYGDFTAASIGEQEPKRRVDDVSLPPPALLLPATRLSLQPSKTWRR